MSRCKSDSDTSMPTMPTLQLALWLVWMQLDRIHNTAVTKTRLVSPRIWTHATDVQQVSK